MWSCRRPYLSLSVTQPIRCIAAGSIWSSAAKLSGGLARSGRPPRSTPMGAGVLVDQFRQVRWARPCDMLSAGGRIAR